MPQIIAKSCLNASGNFLISYIISYELHLVMLKYLPFSCIKHNVKNFFMFTQKLDKNRKTNSQIGIFNFSNLFKMVSYVICSRTISGLFHDFYQCIWSSRSGITWPQPFKNKCVQCEIARNSSGKTKTFTIIFISAFQSPVTYK